MVETVSLCFGILAVTVFVTVAVIIVCFCLRYITINGLVRCCLRQAYVKFKVVARVSDQLSATMYNQILPHGDEAIAETREYHRNVAWTQVHI